ncbi:hypothetical protein D3C78_1393360 [compost metagenome]
MALQLFLGGFTCFAPLLSHTNRFLQSCFILDKLLQPLLSCLRGSLQILLLGQMRASIRCIKLLLLIQMLRFIIKLTQLRPNLLLLNPALLALRTQLLDIVRTNGLLLAQIAQLIAELRGHPSRILNFLIQRVNLTLTP